MTKAQGQGEGHPGRRLLQDTWETGGRGGRTFIFEVRDKVPELGQGDTAPEIVWPPVPPWLLPQAVVDWTVGKGLKEKGKMCAVELGRELHNLKFLTPCYTEHALFPIWSMLPRCWGPPRLG